MNKNFELLERIGRDRPAPETTIAPPCRSPEGNSQNQFDQQNRNNAVLNLVHRLFLQDSRSQPRRIVFAAVDHRNGCSRVASCSLLRSPKSVMARSAWWKQTFAHHPSLRCLESQVAMGSRKHCCKTGQSKLSSSGSRADVTGCFRRVLQRVIHRKLSPPKP